MIPRMRDRVGSLIALNCWAVVTVNLTGSSGIVTGRSPGSTGIASRSLYKAFTLHLFLQRTGILVCITLPSRTKKLARASSIALQLECVKSGLLVFQNIVRTSFLYSLDIQTFSILRTCIALSTLM